MQIIQGTTPTIIINVKDNIDFSQISSVWIFISQRGKVRVDKTIRDITVNPLEKRIKLPLSQEDTLNLREGDATIQVRILMSDGTALGSIAKEIEVLPTDKGGEIESDQFTPEQWTVGPEPTIERIRLNLIPVGTMPICHASQFDKKRQIEIEIYNGAQPYFLSNELLELNIRKPDGNLVSMDIPYEVGSNSIIFETTEQACAVAGKCLCELRVVKGEKDLGSLNFYLVVEAAPDENGITSKSEINNLARQVHDIVVEELADNGAEQTGYDNTESGLEATNVQDAIDEVNTKIDNIPSVDAYTKEEANDKFATKSALNNLSDEVDDKADETEVNQALALKADKTELNDYVKKYGNKELELVPNQTYTNYRMSYRSELPDVVYIASASGYNTKAYKVTAGETYKIRAFGYDVDSFYIGAIGEALVSGGQTTPVKQVILCGGSSYPSDFKNHDITFTANYSGYLYINERPSTDVSSYTKGFEDVVDRNESCLIVNNGNYKHLSYIGNGLYLNREFTRRGPNNLFQLVHVGIGYLTKENAYVETKSYMTTTTDIIGPFSIGKSGWGSNAWTGGNHSVTVDNVACPTAEQLDLKVYVGSELITDNDIYWGVVKFVAKNKLYFAQTITGNTFTGATPAILETRVYSLTNTMNVEVYIELLDDVRFGKYYGMQYVNNNVVTVAVPDDETVITLTDLSSDYSMTHKQPDIILQYTDGEELHMFLHRSGLGSYAHNNGNDNYGVIATYGKTYHTLISNETISTGSKLYWSGEYRMIV